MELKQFTRKPFAIEAIQISQLNVAEVADWCSGTVVDIGTRISGTPAILPAIELVGAGSQEGKVFTGRIGDWVVRHKNVFRIYRNKAFMSCYEEKPVEPVAPAMLMSELKFEGGTWVPAENLNHSEYVRIRGGLYDGAVATVVAMVDEKQARVRLADGGADMLVDVVRLQMFVEDNSLGDIRRHDRVSVELPEENRTGVVDCFMGRVRDIHGHSYVQVGVIMDDTKQVEIFSSRFIKKLEY